MNFRHRWITALALSPVLLFAVALAEPTLPYVKDLFDVSCHGIGDQVICPDNQLVIAVGLYSNVVVTSGLFVILMAVLIAITRAPDRAALRLDLHIVTVVVVVLGFPRAFGGMSGGLPTLTSIAYVAGAVLVIEALARSHTSWLVIGCLLGVVSALAPSEQVIIALFEPLVAAWFAILLLAVVIPARRRPHPIAEIEGAHPMPPGRTLDS